MANALAALARNAGETPSDHSTLVINMRPGRARAASRAVADLGSADEKLAAFCHTTDAANFFLADFECPPELRAFADALIGVSAGRVEFYATDATVAKRAARSTKWVQRSRDAWTEWQKAQNCTFIKVEDHYQQRDTGKRLPHKYTVHLHRLSMETVQDAREAEAWGRSPSAAISREVRARRADVPTDAPRVHRGRKREPDAETVINKHLKTAATLLEQAEKMLEGVRLSQLALSGSARVSPDAEVMGRLRRTVNALAGEAPAPAPEPAPRGVSTYKGEEVDTGGALPFPELSEPSGPAEHLQGGQNVHLKTVHLAQALEALEQFRADVFHITFKDDEAGKAVEHFTVDSHIFKKRLPEYLERSERRRQSFIVRPEAEGRRYLQVDDPESLAPLAPISFSEIETSPASGQAWLAFDGSMDDLKFKSLRDRLLKGCKADKGATGALRWPGSLNFKPEHRRADGTFPRVKIVGGEAGKLTTPEELAALGLLAPPVSSSSAPAKRRPAARASRRERWPDYQIELDKAPQSGGRADRSKADFTFALRCLRWGFDEGATAAKLREVSSKARGRRDDYAEQTVRRAAEVIAQG